MTKVFKCGSMDCRIQSNPTSLFYTVINKKKVRPESGNEVAWKRKAQERERSQEIWKIIKKTWKGNKTEEEQKEGDMRLSKLQGNWVSLEQSYRLLELVSTTQQHQIQTQEQESEKRCTKLPKLPLTSEKKMHKLTLSLSLKFMQKNVNW